MSNQSMFGVGSRLVYDALMNSGNREFLYQGMQALLMGGGFSGSFTSYGVTVAVNGTALPAGSTVRTLCRSQASVRRRLRPLEPGDRHRHLHRDGAMSCDEERGETRDEGGRAAVPQPVGTYCSSCIRILGKCVSCITHTTNKCCFNSVLARIINEQGRLQIMQVVGRWRAP
jgi:conjugal transfer mating pair stabilization protein TraN